MSAIKNYPVLSRSPIEVAIFEIEFNSDVIFQSNNSKKFHSAIKDNFPQISENLNRNIELGNLANTAKTVAVSAPEVTEFRYISSDKNQILAIDKRKFNFSINKAYSNWEQNFPIFLDLWEVFDQLFGDNINKISRISTRFINKIEISDMTSPSDYFNTTLYASEGIIQGEVLDYLAKYSSFLRNENVFLNVTQGFEPVQNRLSPYVFDIDVISVAEIEKGEVPRSFEILREVKNKTFFANITEKTLNLLL